MTHSAWNDLCQHPTTTVSSEKYTQLVYDSTMELHQPVHSILSTLDRRAMALSKVAQFESALRDADFMQHLSPSSPLGYLRKASIYREQGKQHDAITVCTHGLAIIDTTNPDYDALQQAKADAENQLETRIDFISMLPIDLVATTLIPMLMDIEPLDSRRPCPYFYMSNRWRDSIIQYCGGLRFNCMYRASHQAEYEDEEEYDETKIWQLAKFARHTKSLEIYAHCEGTWLADVLRANDFSSLQELRLKDFHTSDVDDFVSAFRSIGNVLTHLDFNQERMTSLSVSQLLTACPNLVSFILLQTLPARFDLLPEMTWPNMTTLSISYGQPGVSRDDTISISQRFPALQKLTLIPCYSIESALMIPRYYTAMNGMHIQHSFSYGTDATLYNRGTGFEETAVTKLSIFREDREIGGSFEDVNAILKQYHNALEEVEWDVQPARYRDVIHNIDEIQDLWYPAIKKLSLWNSGWWILGNAPMLEELELSSQVINTHPEVLNTIPARLNTLRFRFDDGDPLHTEKDVVRYLYRVSQQCQVVEFSIQFDRSGTLSKILGVILYLNHLQCLTVKFDGTWNQLQMETFLEKLVNACPFLSRLHFKCRNSPSTYSISLLKRLARFKHLGLSVNHTEGYHSFWHALRSFSQLRSIVFYPSCPVNMSEFQVFKKQRPDLTITGRGR